MGKNNKNLNVLIVGGSYFIGWDFLNKLSKNNSRIFVLNRGNQHRAYPKGVEHIICDRNNQKQLIDALEEKNIEIVVDFSAFNESQIKNLLSALKPSLLRQYIYISSAAVYLESQRLPIKEDFPTGWHRLWGEYGSNKLKGELTLIESAKSKGFKYTIIRPSYVYGPGNYVYREDFFFDRITQNKPILVPGAGDTILQLGYITDLSDTLIACVDNTKVMNETLNVSGEEMVTFLGLVDIISELIGKIPIVHAVDTNKFQVHDKMIFPFETSTYFVSNSKANDLLNYSPKVTLKDGLSKSYKFWQNRKSNYKKGFIDESLEKSILTDLKRRTL